MKRINWLNIIFSFILSLSINYKLVINRGLNYFINDFHLNYCDDLMKILMENDIRVELDSRDEKLGYKMRESQTRKIPYTLVIGDKERDNNMINYRRHGSQDAISLSVSDFINLITEEINSRGNL